MIPGKTLSTCRATSVPSSGAWWPPSSSSACREAKDCLSPLLRPWISCKWHDCRRQGQHVSAMIVTRKSYPRSAAKTTSRSGERTSRIRCFQPVFVQGRFPQIVVLLLVAYNLTMVVKILIKDRHKSCGRNKCFFGQTT